MKKTGKTNELRNIAGRDIGEETLECFGCGRFWGKDTVVPFNHVGSPFDEAVGKCGMCGEFVYPRSKLPPQHGKVSER